MGERGMGLACGQVRNILFTLSWHRLFKNSKMRYDRLIFLIAASGTSSNAGMAHWYGSKWGWLSGRMLDYQVEGQYFESLPVSWQRNHDV